METGTEWQRDLGIGWRWERKFLLTNIFTASTVWKVLFRGFGGRGALRAFTGFLARAGLDLGSVRLLSLSLGGLLAQVLVLILVRILALALALS